MSIVSERIKQIKLSPSSAISARAMELAREGHDIIRLSAGEPDFDTPKFIKDAAYDAMMRGETKYPPVTGIPELRSAICEKLDRENGLEYAPENVLVCSGGKQVIYNALAASVNPGDEVIITAPYWVSYPDMVTLVGGTPVVIQTEQSNGFVVSSEALEAAITDKTRWFILNSPGNPSGCVYSRDDLAAIGAVLERHPHVWVIADDIYEHVIYDGETFHTIAQVVPSLKDRTLTMNGFSKSYCMTGWRIGYGAGPVELIKAMTKVQSQTQGGVNTMAQWAGVTALRGDASFIAENTRSFEKRRDLVVSMLNQASGLRCEKPKGAFYLYVSCADLIGKRTAQGKVLETDGDVVTYLLDAEGVALVHGEAYGLSPYFRISYAAATDVLEDACRRIQRATAALT
jgi:aspartate aminotransferase